MEEERQERLRILVVDDDRSVLDQYKTIFSPEFTCKPNGAETMTETAGFPILFDLVTSSRNDAVETARNAIEPIGVQVDGPEFFRIDAGTHEDRERESRKYQQL